MNANLDSIATLIREMPLGDLQNMLLRLAEKNEHVLEALYQVQKEQERDIRLKQSVEWSTLDWVEAKIHFEPIIQDELRQCTDLFENRYERGYRGYDYLSDDREWDYTAGLEQLEQWFVELLEMAADGEWVDASVGLLLTLQRLDDWAIENGDENINGEDLQDECAAFWTKAEELAAVIRNSTAPDPNKSAFFLELIDWIIAIIVEEDWSIWQETLSSCLLSLEHYERLKEHITQLEPNLFAEDTMEDPVDTDVIRWWVQVSLDMNQEKEAKRAEASLTAFDAETSACFARYYESLNRTEEALARLHLIIHHIQEQIQLRSSDSFSTMNSQYVSDQQANRYFEWLISLYERIEHQPEAETWRVQWFKTIPSLELFIRCLEVVTSEEKEQQANNWISYVRSKGSYRFNDLLIDMHLHVSNPDGAWSI